MGIFFPSGIIHSLEYICSKVINSINNYVTLVTWAGEPEEYIQQIKIFFDLRPQGLGPTGIAIREGDPYICNDFLADPRTEIWHERAKKAGIQASAAFPFNCGGSHVFLSSLSTRSGHRCSIG